MRLSEQCDPCRHSCINWRSCFQELQESNAIHFQGTLHVSVIRPLRLRVSEYCHSDNVAILADRLCAYQLRGMLSHEVFIMIGEGAFKNCTNITLVTSPWCLRHSQGDICALYKFENSDIPRQHREFQEAAFAGVPSFRGESPPASLIAPQRCFFACHSHPPSHYLSESKV